MISYYIQFYSAEYYFILAISRSNRPHCASQMNVSDDEDSQTVVGDDYDSQSSNEENDTIFKPKIGSLRFAPIQAGDIVELTHVANDNQLYIRSTKHDVNYENILKRTNAMISEKRQHHFWNQLKMVMLCLFAIVATTPVPWCSTKMSEVSSWSILELL